MAQKKNNNQGFTLVELIVVIVIILILAALAVPSITRYVQKSKVAKCANQRHELETQFQIMGTDVPEIALCDQIGEVNTLLGENVLNYMVKNGYCTEDITVCPVYNEKYTVELTVESGQQQVDFSCSCVDNVKGYVSMCGNYYKELSSAGHINREAVIQKVADEKGFLKISDTIKNKTVFADKDLYWKPYYLADGKMILYGTTNTGNAWSNWEGYLIYVDGQIYQSTNADTNGKPKNTNVASLKDIRENTLEKYLEDNKFENISK